MQRFLNATVACLVIVGFAVAGEYAGLITSVSKDEVKVTIRKKGEKKGEEKTMKAKGLKVLKGKEEISIDAVTEMIGKAKGKVKGVFGKVTTEGEGDAEVVVSITVGGGGKKK